MGPTTSWPGGQGLTAADAAAWGPMLGVLFGFIAVWITISAITGWLAGRKNRDSGLWFLLAFLTGPIGLLAIFLMKPVPKKDGPRA